MKKAAIRPDLCGMCAMPCGIVCGIKLLISKGCAACAACFLTRARAGACAMHKTMPFIFNSLTCAIPHIPHIPHTLMISTTYKKMMAHNTPHIPHTFFWRKKWI